MHEHTHSQVQEILEGKEKTCSAANVQLFTSSKANQWALKFSLFTVILPCLLKYDQINKFACQKIYRFFYHFFLTLFVPPCKFFIILIVEETGCCLGQSGSCWLYPCLMCSSASTSCKLVVRSRGLIRFGFNHFVKSISCVVFCTIFSRYIISDCISLAAMRAAIGGHCPDPLIR